MNIWRWNHLISSVPTKAQITLGEGDTPLLRSRRIGPSLGIPNLYFKLESTNPTGSYKDRFAFAAVSHMLAAGKTKCIATSSGNTGAALAAYCTAAGIDCRIVIVEGAPVGKLKQMMAYGAGIARIRAFGTDPDVTTQVFDILQKLGSGNDAAMQVSGFVFCPDGMSGVQTIAYELAEQSNGPIHHVFCPAGGGGLCVAMARGFRQLRSSGQLAQMPAVECVQPVGNNTIAGPLRDGLPKAQTVQCTTQISGLQVASVVDGDLVIEECRDTGGTGHLVDDDFIWATQKRLAREEGIFTEPAGATSVAGAIQAVRNGDVSTNATIVCIVSGSGFKDEASIERMNSDVNCPVFPADEIPHWFTN